jgi:hypothetical protein
VAFDSTEELSRRSPPGIWRMGDLEAGIFGQSKRVPGSGRLGHDAPVSKIFNNSHLVRDWVIIFIFLASAGAVFYQIFWGFA